MAPAPEVTPNSATASTYDRVRKFDSPFVHIVMNYKVEKYCSHCLRRPPANAKLLTCGSCNFAKYCSKDCQKLAWKLHRPECRRLKAVFPNLPMTEVLFMSRCIDKVLFLEEHGDKYGWEKHRKWNSLMGHQEDIKADQERYAYFQKILGKMKAYRKEEMIDDEKFYDIFCKATINSHSIHTNAGDEIGISLDLGISSYDHCCRPNCSMVFDGFIVYLRPLTPETDPNNTKTSFISYIDVGRSRYQRQKELQSKWYFTCGCERCSDPEDDLLTSLKCMNVACDEPLVISETAEPMMISCPRCRKIADEDYVKQGQQTMVNLPARYTTNSDPKELQKLLDTAETILHPRNIYLCRLKTAIFHLTGKLQDKLPEMQKLVYENYRMCFPNMDRHNGFQLLHIVKALIEQKDRKAAIPKKRQNFWDTLYAYDAMSIFEICFGMEHPYYLQTLALWTYLEREIPKTDEELFQLMTFTENRPVDISSLLNPN